MSAIGTRTAEVIDLAEDSETFSVMLVYIYPSSIPPPLGSFELLEKSLGVAQKYDLKAMLQRLDRALSTESSYKELIKSDPLRIFHLSVTYGLQQSQTVAIRGVQPRHCDLLYPDGIIQLAKTYPSSSHVIQLMGIQAARAEALFRCFYDLGYGDGLGVCNTTPDDKNSWLIRKDCKTKMIADFNPLQNAKESAFAFEPPPGGDISLLSTDGSVFRVHSVILGLVSSVFADMFSIGRPSGEEIQLDDDSESISLMLATIYPSSVTPTIDKIDTLEKCLKIAQKYNIEAIIQTLDHDLSRSEAQTRLIRSNDPLRIFRLAVTYGLRECKALAAKAIMPRHIDLHEPAEIVKAAQEHPASAHIVGLISAQILRAKILADVFFNLEGDFLPETYVVAKHGQESEFADGDGGGLMMCDDCAMRLDDLWLDDSRPLSYIPSWVYGWSRHAYETLTAMPLDECGPLFEPAVLNIWVKDHMDACANCIEVAIEARTYFGGTPGEVFENWASKVRGILRKRLSELDCLYSL
ncbi:hypothetical protein FRC06_001219 [Ceratobasidium sp. 370]|nr:hypothetical protein FRC06_001219 [Ceratobasidium sp. 370]